MAKATRYTRRMIESYCRQGLWTRETMSDIWDRNAEVYPGNEALVDSRNRLTWADVKLWTDRVALGLRGMGFVKDDALVVQLPTCSEMLMLLIACEKAGLLYVPVMYNLRERELEFILEKTEAKGIVIPLKLKDTEYVTMVRGLLSSLPGLKHIILWGEEHPEGTSSLSEMAERPVENEYPVDYLDKTKMPPFEVAFIRPTSGTTGLSKLVELPACCRNFQSRILVQMLEMTHNDIVAAISPVAGGPNTPAYLGAPMAGAKVVMLERWNPEAALQLMERERVTLFGSVPTQLFKMIHHPNFSKYDLSSLRMVVGGSGQALTHKLGVEAEAKLGCPIIQIFGATEWGGTLSTSPLDSQEIRFNTVGKASDKGAVRIVDDNDNEVPPGESGELLVGGAASSSGYYKSPEATRQIARLDNAGNVVICGRKKDMIIRGGTNIYSAEIENLLGSHPKVADVAVVAMPDQVMGEKVCAYVSPTTGKSLNFDEMVAYLKEKRLTTFKLPERLEIMERLPLGKTGEKTDKEALRKDIAAKLEAEGKA
jgi:non-ribosomal peptide synthetase component E (peptide arylation enzyme)